MICGDIHNIEKIREGYINDPKLIIPVMSDHKAHWCVNRLSFAYIFNLHTHQELMMGFNHNDLFPFKQEEIIPFLGNSTFVFKKKFLWGLENWKHLIDVEMVYWFKTNQRFLPNTDPVIKRYWSDFKDTSNVNDFIPIMKHLDSCRFIKDSVLSYLDKSSLPDSFFKYQDTLDNLVEIETQGICVVENS